VVTAVVSDVHCGSTLAATPPEGVRLDEGGKYLPSKVQSWLWDCWVDYWQQIAQLVKREHATLRVVLNGDSFEGQHHGSTQVVSTNPEVQAYLAARIFGVPRDLKPAHLFIVRGTEAHVGPSGATEEAFARSIRAEQDTESGRWSWWHLRLAVHGIRFDFQHHPSTSGNLPWTRPQAAQRLAFRIWSEHRLRDFDAPHYAFRSHRHVLADSGDAYPVRAIITPAWQAKTAFAHKVAADSIADVGGLAVIVRPNGEHELRKLLYPPTLPKVWEAA